MVCKKVVITGGPCAGKSAAISMLRERMREQALFVPEAATMLLDSGFPAPNRDLGWSEEWQRAFVKAVSGTQEGLEDAYSLLATNRNIEYLICDRGLLDGAAYLPGGLDEYRYIYGPEGFSRALDRYSAVLHLESLATGFPAIYGNTGNSCRFEDLGRAQTLEQKIRAVWSNHPSWHFVNAETLLETKLEKVFSIVQEIIAM